MAITAFGFPGTVQEVEFAKMMTAVGGHGLIGTFGGSQFGASRVPGARSMSLQAGVCWAPGILVVMDATTTSPASAANTSGLPRIDVIAMRVDWSAHTATLVNVPGTPNSSPQPPAFTNTSTTLWNQPGVKFDIPLRQAVLPSGDADYTATAISQGDRRVWLQDGRMLQSGTAVGAESLPGRLIIQPDSGRITYGASPSGTWTVEPERDTGWDAIVSPYGGFTGSTWGRIKNGMATITFPWTKGSNPITSTDIAFNLPSAYIPGFDITGVLFAGSPKAPILLTMHSGSPLLTMDSVTLNAGGAIRGSITYPVG